MPKGVLIAIIVVAVILVAGGVWLGVGFAVTRDAGPMADEQRRLTEFSQVDVSGEGTLIVSQGDVAQLRIEAPRNILDRVETTVSDDTLHIHHDWNWFDFGALWGNASITYYLTVPDLKAIKLSGAIDVEGGSRFDTDEFVIECSGSSDVDLEVRTGSLRVDTSGSSEITLRGQADAVVFNSSGSTTISAAALVSRIATVDCSGSSEIEINASEQLNVHASGSSMISYVGDPILDTDISGSGEVRKLER